MEQAVQYIDIKYSTDDMSHITYSNSELKYKHTYVADRGLPELIKIFKTKVWGRSANIKCNHNGSVRVRNH